MSTQVFNPQLPVDSVPVGAIIAMETATPPNGYLLADGSTFSASEFPDLNTYLGGTTLPDYRDRFLLGAGAKALSSTGGALDHVHSQPLHDHTQPAHLHTITHTHSTPNHQHGIAHTHQVDPPPTVSGGPSATNLNLALGVTATPTATHTHTTNIPPFTSGAASTPNTDTSGGSTTGASSAANSGNAGDENTGTAGNEATGAENPPYTAINWFIKAITFSSDGGVAEPTFYAINFDDVGGGVSYAGFAAPGSIDSASVWQIRRVTEAGLDSVLDYADGDSQFDNVWDDRLILSYS